MIRLWGSIFVLAGCAGLGFSISSHYKMRLHVVQSFLRMMEFMAAELSYKVTALPELCRSAAGDFPCFQGVLLYFSDSLESQIEPDPFACMEFTLARTGSPCAEHKLCLQELAQILGNSDLQGQLRQLDGLHHKWSQRLIELEKDVTDKVRNYRVIGICAGCALAILLV